VQALNPNPSQFSLQPGWSVKPQALHAPRHAVGQFLNPSQFTPRPGREVRASSA